MVLCEVWVIEFIADFGNIFICRSAKDYCFKMGEFVSWDVIDRLDKEYFFLKNLSARIHQRHNLYRNRVKQIRNIRNT